MVNVVLLLLLKCISVSYLCFYKSTKFVSFTTDPPPHVSLSLQLDQCRASLSTAEESRDQLRRDTLDAERRYSQAQDASENYRREVTELRRSLGDVTKERDTISQSNGVLREALRSAETERIR